MVEGNGERILPSFLLDISLFFVGSKESFKLVIGKISQRRANGEERFPFNRYSWSGGDGCSARIRGQSKLHFDLCIRAGPKTVGFHVRLSLRIFEAQPSDFTDPWPINLVYLGGLSSLLYRGPARVPGISLHSKISLVALNHEYACISLVISRIFHLFLLKVFQKDPRYFSKTLFSDRRIMDFYNNPIL